MKTKKTTLVFIIISILYFLFVLLCFPTYSQLKFMSWQGHEDDIWINIRDIVINNCFLFGVHKALRHKIPDWSMLIAIMINVFNMLLGFINHMKKWWYYLLLLISVLVTVVLIDCYNLSSSLE